VWDACGRHLKGGSIKDPVKTQLCFALVSSEVLGLNLTTYKFYSYHIYLIYMPEKLLSSWQGLKIIGN
jgi:hypothetical protein